MLAELLRDLQLVIASFCDPDDLVFLRLTCKRLRKVLPREKYAMGITPFVCLQKGQISRFFEFYDHCNMPFLSCYYTHAIRHDSLEIIKRLRGNAIPITTSNIYLCIALERKKIFEFLTNIPYTYNVDLKLVYERLGIVVEKRRLSVRSHLNSLQTKESLQSNNIPMLTYLVDNYFVEFGTASLKRFMNTPAMDYLLSRFDDLNRVTQTKILNYTDDLRYHRTERNSPKDLQVVDNLILHKRWPVLSNIFEAKITDLISCMKRMKEVAFDFEPSKALHVKVLSRLNYEEMKYWLENHINLFLYKVHPVYYRCKVLDERVLDLFLKYYPNYITSRDIESILESVLEHSTNIEQDMEANLEMFTKKGISFDMRAVQSVLCEFGSRACFNYLLQKRYRASVNICMRIYGHSRFNRCSGIKFYRLYDTFGKRRKEAVKLSIRDKPSEILRPGFAKWYLQKKIFTGQELKDIYPEDTALIEWLCQ
jgi:hypothetical protein